MVEVLNKVDRVLTVKPTPRVERLREAFVRLNATASIDRARIETRVMKETEEELMVTRRAKVFAAVVREMPIDIYPDELLVGFTSVRPWCHEISPADGPALEAELEEGAQSHYTGAGAEYAGPTTLSDEDKRELREELIPYWKGAEGKYEKTRSGRNSLKSPPELERLNFGGMHYGHNCHAFEKVLKKGFLGIKEEAEERLARLNLAEPEELRKVTFLRGVIMAMEAAAEVGKRFAAKARELAEKEEDAKRQMELLRIAEVCDWVPANPARTLYEALQSYYFAWLLLLWETSYAWSFTPGRADQYLYPYYERDMREGKLTKEAAQELIDCYIIKLNQITQYCYLGVGGVKANGNDATNELSYMFIEAMMHTRLLEPILGVLIHGKTPDDLLIKACQLCSLGTGHPQFINNDVLVDQILGRGSMGGPPITLENARAATPMGCIEPGIPGKDSGYLNIFGARLATAMELVMTNGWSQYDHRKIGLETSDPRQFKSFEEVREAFHKQVAWMRRNSQISGNITEQTIAELSPTVYESALIEDCIEKGICREEGGAHYNFNTGSVPTGSTDAGDSLTAIRKLVFDDKKITMDQLCDALDKNFEGYDGLRQMLLKAPKFGNDDDYADEQVAWVMHEWVSEAKKIKNARGGYCCPGGSPLSGYVSQGMVVGALPSGRLAGKALSDAASPSAGGDLNGPTAVLKSMGKIDNVEILGGVVLNMRIDPVVFKDRDGYKRLADLIRAFVDQKIYHVQINVVSSDTLRAAQKEPDKYRGLVVKVAGYNAFFVQLSKPLQDGIIARTEHKL